MDVSGCSHEEAVEVLTRASEPIMVQVRHRHSDTESEVRSDHADTGDMTHAHSGASQCSREIQTEPESETICDHCGEFYGSYTNYNCDSLGPALGELGDSLIYPELQYEVSAMLSSPGSRDWSVSSQVGPFLKAVIVIAIGCSILRFMDIKI